MMDAETIRRVEMRRRVRAEFRTRATLEIPGITRAGAPWTVETRDTNEWGVRLSSPSQLPQLPVIIHLRAPGGAQLCIRGTVIWTAETNPGAWEAGIAFDTAQPCMSVAHADRANYGT